MVHTTQKHPFWDQTRHTWINAADLHSGDRLKTATHGATVTVNKTTVVAGAADMWDLTIPTVHDFYITTGASTTTSILVHNCPEPVPSRMTTPEATQAAKKLGYSNVRGASKGQAIYTNGKNYISPDATGHVGGVWKMARTPSDLLSKETRMGTYDENLNWIAP